MRSLICALTLTACVAGCAAERRTATIPAGPLADFERRVEAYNKLHEEQEKKVPALKDKSKPELITAHEQAFAAALQKARADAKPGDIITPAAKARLVEIVRAEMTGPQNKDAREAAKVGNPPKDAEGSNPTLKINAVYPKSAPLTLMPPSVLLKLPKLPETLEYRFVGRTLILRDTVANIIVDYATEVAPPL